MDDVTRTVDLNADLGEGFGAWKMGDDAAMLQVVSSANVACGFHAGDPDIMTATFRLARENGVAVGAHPGFPDRSGFGRRQIPFSTGEIERLVAYQIGAAQALASCAGTAITYVKAHGALGNLAAAEPAVAEAVARAIAAVDAKLTLLAIALSAQVKAGAAAGLTVAHEVFADRAYTEAGLLVPRSEAGAVLKDAERAAERAMRMVTVGAIETVSGQSLSTPIDSICVHGDTPGAVTLAQMVRKRLTQAGVVVQAFS